MFEETSSESDDTNRRVRFATINHRPSEYSTQLTSKIPSAFTSGTSDLESSYWSSSYGSESTHQFILLPNPNIAPSRNNTIFVTTGEQAGGVRARIRQRKRTININHSSDQSVSEVVSLDSYLSKDALLELRARSWLPRTRSMPATLPLSLNMSYSIAWEVCKRGTHMLQRTKRNAIEVLFKRKYKVRFVVVDGTDCRSFMTVYKIVNDQPILTKQVFSAADLMNAVWDPIDGSALISYFERVEKSKWRYRREFLKGMPWNFLEAVFVCLREVSIWASVSKIMGTVLQDKNRTRAKHQQGSLVSHGEEERCDIRNRSKAYAVPKVDLLMKSLYDAGKLQNPSTQ